MGPLRLKDPDSYVFQIVTPPITVVDKTTYTKVNKKTIKKAKRLICKTPKKKSLLQKILSLFNIL